MAKKTYRVVHGTHSIPNPEFKPDKEGSHSHVNVEAGKTFTIDEERAVAFTGGPNPKLVEVGSEAERQHIRPAAPTPAPAVQATPVPPTPPATPPTPNK
jgi:hypothetical protein